MKSITCFLSLLLLTSTLGLSAISAWGAESGATKAISRQGDNCHMKFPAIREDTLFWDRPVLKDARDGDIIDFYGPCNYDPLGREEIQRQRFQLLHDFTREG